MKKNLLAVGIFIFPMCTNAETADAYIATYCNGSYNSSAERAFCTDASQACSSSGGVMPHVISGGIYSKYTNCVRAYVGGADNSATDYPYIYCFTDSDACAAVANCHPDYYGTQPVISITDGIGSVGRLTTISNIAQFKCCHDGGCTGYKNMGTTNAGDQAVRFAANSCLTSGTCATTLGYVTCNIGYYSSKGLTKNAITSNTTNPAMFVGALGCTKCSTATGNDNATTDGYEKNAITQCLLPKGYSECDDSGCFIYEEPCYYKD